MSPQTLWDLYSEKLQTLENENTFIPKLQNISQLLKFIHSLKNYSPSSSTSTITIDNDIFYNKYKFLCSILKGNYAGIKRIAYELCKTQFENKVLYTEVRFNPYLLSNIFHNSSLHSLPEDEYGEIIEDNPSNVNKYKNTKMDDDNPDNKELEIIIECVINGLNEGCKQFGIYVYPIISCLRYRPDLSNTLVNLAFKYRDQRQHTCNIVGLDLFAGHELLYHSRLHFHSMQRRCKALDIKTSVHCGDSFDLQGKGILNALHQLNPYRIAYVLCSRIPKHIIHRIYGRQMHLELTPSSNLLQFSNYYQSKNVQNANENNMKFMPYYSKKHKKIFSADMSEKEKRRWFRKRMVEQTPKNFSIFEHENKSDLSDDMLYSSESEIETSEDEDDDESEDDEENDEKYDICSFMHWLRDNGANFSISTDFPILLGNDKQSWNFKNEMSFCMSEFDLNEEEIGQTCLNAMRAAFVNEFTKNDILNVLRQRWRYNALNIHPHNFHQEFEDKTWTNSELLNVHLLRPKKKDLPLNINMQ